VLLDCGLSIDPSIVVSERPENVGLAEALGVRPAAYIPEVGYAGIRLRT
jgi:hypothetical protein